MDSTVRFTRSAEVRPDIVYRRGRTWLLCEVQNKLDERKAQSWPMAVAALHHETRRMGDLIVITASAAVARWAAKVAHARGSGGTTSRLTPVVLLLDGPRTRALLDSNRPALALCAAWAMQARHGPAALRIVEQAIEVSNHLPPPLRKAQWRAIFNVLSDRMRSRLREVAMNPDSFPENAPARKLRLFLEAMGEKRGRVEGRAEGQRNALLLVLAERGLVPTVAQRARVQACTDTAELNVWVKRAVTAESVAQVLGPKAAAKPAASRRPAARRPAARRPARTVKKNTHPPA
jgi:hypothetical protein